MPTFRSGSVNLAGIQNPAVYVDIIPPTPIVNGVPTNIQGVVGVASWGPVGAALPLSGPSDASIKYGVPIIRPYDLATHVWAASSVGAAVNFRGVRVTDGTDAAATATVQTSGGTATAKYTGSLGNQISLNFQKGVNSGSYNAVVNFPGANPEVWQNITNGVASFTVTAPTGLTSVPGIAIGAPNLATGQQAVAAAQLKVSTAPTVVSGGTSGFVVGDTINLPYGVVLTVATVASGAVATVTLTNPGQILVGSAPSNPVAMVSTSGSGVGTPTFTLAWTLGTPIISNPGQGYTTAPTCSFVGGGGTGGSLTAVISFWAGLAQAINYGTAQRGASNYLLFTAGASTAAPTTGVATALSGGSDGASGVGTAQMLGSDTLPRKGMYALRATGCDGFDLCDVTDTTSWATQISFAISETMWAALTTAAGDSIENCVATRQSAGVDDTNFWLCEGDWPTFYDTQNGLARLVSPQAFQIGLAGNLSPEQSPINKNLIGVVATQTSTQGLVIADADETVAQTGGIDVIGQSEDLGETFFSFLTGRNGSSNTAANGMEYTRLTNFIARSLQGSATRSIVGLLQSSKSTDPTRSKAKMILDTFFGGLASPSVGSNGYGLIDSWSVKCDLTNNPPNLQALGFLFAYCAVRYLNVVRYFVIKLAGGGNVQVSVQNTPPSPSQFTS